MKKPIEWRFGRDGRRWTEEEFDARLAAAPEKIEYDGGIFTDDDQRRVVLAMLIENLGIDEVVRYGNLADWQAAVADRAAREQQTRQ